MIYELMVCPTAQLAIDLDHADFHGRLTHAVMPVAICQNTEQLALLETSHVFTNCTYNELHLEQ